MNGSVAPSSGDRPSTGKLRLLLAEDERSHRDFLHEVLAEEYEVELATNGEEAWTAVQQRVPDLILADVQMPALDGLGLLRRLRGDGRSASVPVVLMTANNRKEVLLEALAAGLDDFLLKPFLPLELLARLRCQRRMIDLRQAATERIARQEAEAVERAKNHFLASLSHELRTPLTPVYFTLSLLMRKKGLPPDLYKGLETIQRNVEAETRLINDLLDFSHLAHGELALDKAPLDLHVCLLQAVEDSRADLAAKDLRFTVNLDAGRHQLFGDATRLRQVFWHLLQNAAKFTPARGQVSLRSSNDGEDIVVEVSDSGQGIPAEDLPKIFRAFEHESSQPGRLDAGLGLRLTVSRALVAAHEGQLTAASAGTNQGATFRVCLNTAKHSD